jgi:hypothetical protein
MVLEKMKVFKKIKVTVLGTNFNSEKPKGGKKTKTMRKTPDGYYLVNLITALSVLPGCSAAGFHLFATPWIRRYRYEIPMECYWKGGQREGEM